MLPVYLPAYADTGSNSEVCVTLGRVQTLTLEGLGKVEQVDV